MQPKQQGQVFVECGESTNRQIFNYQIITYSARIQWTLLSFILQSKEEEWVLLGGTVELKKRIENNNRIYG